jgi:AcrR family transcriptional regulator
MDEKRWAWLSQPTRQRILEAAEVRFAEVGYDAARIDEVATNAGVSKSHLYYHFKGKAVLLSTLVELRTAEILKTKDEALRDVQLTAAPDAEELTIILRRFLKDVLAPHHLFLRVLLMELLKGSDATEVAVSALKSMVSDAARRFAEMGWEGDPTRAEALWLHFGIVPALFAVALERPLLGEPLDFDMLASDLATIETALVNRPREEDTR